MTNLLSHSVKKLFSWKTCTGHHVTFHVIHTKQKRWSLKMRSYFLLCCFLGQVLVIKGPSRKEQSLRTASCCSDGESPFILERRAPAGRRVRCGDSSASRDTVNKIKPRSFKEGWGERLTVSEGTMGFSTLGLASQIAPFPSSGNSSLCCHNQVALWTLPLLSSCPRMHSPHCCLDSSGMAETKLAL